MSLPCSFHSDTSHFFFIFLWLLFDVINMRSEYTSTGVGCFIGWCRHHITQSLAIHFDATHLRQNKKNNNRNIHSYKSPRTTMTNLERKREREEVFIVYFSYRIRFRIVNNSCRHVYLHWNNNEYLWPQIAYKTKSIEIIKT